MRSSDVSQSVLAPAGVHASSIAQLWTLMLCVATTVFVVVLVALFIALVRGIRNRKASDELITSERALSGSVAAAVAATVLILVGLLVASVWTGRAVGSLQAASALTIEIIGHQWWWEIHYDDAVPSQRVVTANEFHIPVGQPIVFKVTSRDVIHSFWIPNLQGKRDLIPGYTTAIRLQADRPGIFRGQCAEFCGLQHAHMALDVVAESQADFAAWLTATRQPAREPQGPAEVKGRDVFMQTRCAGCHTVRGSEAAGQIAPDLTHIATRSTLGAGTVPNTPDHLAAWIRDSHAAKPGNQMPPNQLPAEDLRALVEYLEALR